MRRKVLTSHSFIIRAGLVTVKGSYYERGGLCVKWVALLISATWAKHVACVGSQVSNMHIICLRKCLIVNMKQSRRVSSSVLSIKQPFLRGNMKKAKLFDFFSRSPTLPQFQLKSMSLSEEIFVCNIGVSLTISIYKTTHSYWYISQELNILLTFVILSVLAKCNTNRIHWTWRVLFNWNIERNEHTSRKHMWYKTK